MDSEEIKKARRANLAEYLIARGEPLVKNGSRYRHKEHDSLVFTDNAFYWNSKALHGNSIDFLMLYYDMDFKRAVNELSDDNGRGHELGSTHLENQHNELEFCIMDIDLASTYDNVYEYLCKARGISYDIVTDFIKQGLIFQQFGTNNAVFLMLNKERVVVGAEYCGTSPQKRFKGIAKGSKYGYGYNVIYSTPKTALFFESAIDLLSFIDVTQIQGKTINNVLLVSMAGLKPSIITNSMKAFEVKNCVLCVDNDTAGDNFIATMCEGYKVHRPPKDVKDWNDYLLQLKSM